MEKLCYGCMSYKGDASECPYCGYSESKQNEGYGLPAGKILQGQYLVGKMLYHGSSESTYLGWDDELKSRVVITEYYPSACVYRTSGQEVMVTNEQMFQLGKAYFMEKCRMLARLRGIANTIQIYHLFAENNTVYMVMEYEEGITLWDHIQKRGSMTVEKTFKLMRPLVWTMYQAHKQGVCHRDISPRNILIKNDGTGKIMGFKIPVPEELDYSVRTTSAFQANPFVPAEAFQGREKQDHRMDEYALCATMYYCMTGKLPADAISRIMGTSQISWDQIPGLTQSQAMALEKGMALKPEDRFPDMGALGKALFT